MFRLCCFLSQSIMKLIHCGPVAAAKGGLPAQGWGKGERRRKEEGGGGRALR